VKSCEIDSGDGARWRVFEHGRVWRDHSALSGQSLLPGGEHADRGGVEVD